MKIPDFEPRLIIPHNYRKVYVGKDKKRYIVEYINSLEEGGEIIQRIFDNWNACKNYLLAENFIKLDHKKNIQNFAKLSKIDRIMEK